MHRQDRSCLYQAAGAEVERRGAAAGRYQRPTRIAIGGAAVLRTPTA